MDLIFDAVTGERLTSLIYPQVATDTPGGKLMAPLPLRIQYAAVNGSTATPCAAPGGSPLKFALKPVGHFSDAVFDVFTDVFTAPGDPTQPGAYYTGTIVIDSVALRALFPVASDGTSATFVTLIGEVKSGSLPTQTFNFVVYNNLIKGSESPAVAVAGPSGYPAPTAVLTAGNEDVYTFFCLDPTTGDFGTTGAPAYFVTAELYDADHGSYGSPGVLVMIAGARNLTLLACSSAGITTMGTLPAGLSVLDLNDNAMLTAAQDAILSQLVANGKVNGVVDLSLQTTTAEPSSAGLANAAILQSRGWTVYYGN